MVMFGATEQERWREMERNFSLKKILFGVSVFAIAMTALAISVAPREKPMKARDQFVPFSQASQP